MIDNIRIPDDINRAIIYINVLILVAILSTSIIGVSSGLIPRPLLFIWTSLSSIFACLCIWGYQRGLYIEFMKKYGGLPLKEWEYYRQIAQKINLSAIPSVVFFFVLHGIATVGQII